MFYCFRCFTIGCAGGGGDLVDVCKVGIGGHVPYSELGEEVSLLA